MLLSAPTLNTIRQAIVARDKTIQEKNLAVYKELGITPSMFGYYDGNWEYWEKQNLTLTLDATQRIALKNAIVEVASIRNTQGRNYSGTTYYGYSPHRLGQNSIDALDRIGLTPRTLGISNAETWKNY